MDFPYLAKTASGEDTEALGARFAHHLLKMHKPGSVCFVAMFGDLGAGKTAFVRGSVSVLSPSSYVQSPTYTIVNEYRNGTWPVIHIDAYRLETEDDLLSVGFYDYLDEDCVCFSEWSERLGDALPQHRYEVKIDRIDNGSARSISIKEINNADTIH